MADVQIYVAGTAAAPLSYEIPNAQELIPLAINAVFDGSGAAGDYMPTLEVVSDAGIVVARVPAARVIAGSSGEVTWAPALTDQDPLTRAQQSIDVNVAAAGNTQLVAASPGHSIRVLSLGVMAAAVVTLAFQDTGTTRFGPIALIGSTGIVLNRDGESWWFQCATGQPLFANLTAPVQVGGVLTYVLV